MKIIQQARVLTTTAVAYDVHREIHPNRRHHHYRPN